MKRSTVLLVNAVLLLCALIFPTCQEKPIDPQPEEVLTEEGDIFPLEVALLMVKGERVGTGKVQGTLNGETIEVQLLDTAIVFLVPDIAPGTYLLEAKHEGKLLTSSVRVKELLLPYDPEQIFLNTVSKSDASVLRLKTNANSLPEGEKQAFLNDIQTVSAWLAGLRKQYGELSPEEKVKFARALSANKWWLDEVHAAVTDLSADATQLKLKKDAVVDYEAKIEQAMGKYVNAKVTLIRHVPKIALLITSGALVGGPVGAAIGAGIALGNFILDFKEVGYAQERLLDASFSPFMDLDSYKLAKNTVTFINKEAREMETAMTYRSPYNKQNDAPILSTFAMTLRQVKAAWQSFAPYLPSALRPPRVLEDVQGYRTTERAVHSKYLVVSGISNSSVVLKEKREKDGRLVLTFENEAATDQEFTFKLDYSNSRFSPGLSKTVSAVVLAGPQLTGWYVGKYRLSLGSYAPGIDASQAGQEGKTYVYITTTPSRGYLAILYIESLLDGMPDIYGKKYLKDFEDHRHVEYAWAKSVPSGTQTIHTYFGLSGEVEDQKKISPSGSRAPESLAYKSLRTGLRTDGYPYIIILP